MNRPKTFYKPIRNVASWTLSVGRKFFRVVPSCTLWVVFFTLLSQLALLLAFFLPLKVLILLGSSVVPSYFPGTWRQVGLENLVIFLSAGAVGFYLIYLTTDKAINFFVERGARSLLEKSHKIVLFKNDGEIAIRAYHRFSRSLAGLVFIGLSLVIMGSLYPYLAISVVGFWLVLFILISSALRFFAVPATILDQNMSGKVNALGGIGFLSAFLFIVTDFLLPPAPPSVIVVIICLLLVRQFMTKITSLFSDISSLYAQKLQISTLFFHDHKFVADKSRDDRNFWSLSELTRREEWLGDVLFELLGVLPARIKSVWLQTNVVNIMVFVVEVYDDNGYSQGTYLVKLFGRNKLDLALQESSLLAECKEEDFPSPQFLGESKVDSYHCHLFKWGKAKENTLINVNVKRQEIFLRLLSYEPPKKLVDRYNRSRLLLWQRIKEGMVNQLHSVTSNPKQLHQLVIFEQKIEYISSRLQNLPMQLVNHDLQPDMLKFNEDGDVTLIHWGRWSIEPVGASWPTSEQELNSLDDALKEAKKKRKTLLTVTSTDVRLASLIFSLESLLNRQQYVKVLDLLPLLLMSLEDRKNEGDYIQ